MVCHFVHLIIATKKILETYLKVSPTLTEANPYDQPF